MLTFFTALNWFALVVGYGVLIPNTGRRCARVVGVLAVAPVVVYLGVRTGGRGGEGAVPGCPSSGVPCSSHSTWGSRPRSPSTGRTGSRRCGGRRRRPGGWASTCCGRSSAAAGWARCTGPTTRFCAGPAAIKLIRPEKAGDPATLARFEREVQATATLTHPNTVQVYDYGRAEDGTFYYVMEYLPGVTLDELVGAGRPAAAGPGGPLPAAALRGAAGGARHRAGPPRPQAGQRHGLRPRRRRRTRPSCSTSGWCGRRARPPTRS